MQALVTVIRTGAEPQDVLIKADESATAATVAQQLAAFLDAAGTERSPLPPSLAASLLESGPQHEPYAHQPYAQPGPPVPGDSPAHPTLWVDGRAAPPQTPVGTLLRDGMRITLDDRIGPLLWSGEPTGHYELRVVAGPGAGRVARLSFGAATIGSAPSNTVIVTDPLLAPLAARAAVDIHGRVTVRPQPGVPAYLDDQELTAEQEWPLGALLAVGESLITLERPMPPDAHLAPTGDGGAAYNRPPRLSSPHTPPRLVIPSKPTRAGNARFNLITAIVPLVFGVMMYLITGYVYMLLFCLMSPIMAVGHFVNESRYRKKTYQKSVGQYRQEMIDFHAMLTAMSREDQRVRRTAFPDPAEILLIASGPRGRLWERRLTDHDAMQLRVGMAHQPADITMVASGSTRMSDPVPDPPVIANVPVTLSFPELGVVGVAGARAQALSTARWFLDQAATLHSPRDLSVVLLSSSPDAASVWNWVHWLPHTQPRQGQSCVALLGTEPELISRRVSEVLTELNRRQALRRTAGFSQQALRPDPAVLVVLDGARLLRRMPGVPQLLQEGPEHGIYALCIDEEERLLPEECRAVVSWPAGSVSRVQLRGAGLEQLGEVLADQVPVEWCELLSRSLAPVRDVSRDDAGGALPTAARLLSLLGMPNPAGEDIERVWRAGGESTAAPIGLAADGPFVLDIRRDGPHALVAGTTGAGKSELLQTIIASLAVVNHPESLNFVLIDYKGGSAFQDCANLPHTVGMVSDLDAHLTERALASLAAELHRRETILFNSGNKDIEDYNDDRKQRPELGPMPRLVIIIDEFASLVAELPDFIAGLVDIARRGRSLGVHLVLATQRPAGVVSADIKANTNLRIALRVTDAKESVDVIDAPDSAAIAKATPGRAYVRSGAQSLVGVQSARIGGRRPREDTGAASVVVTPVGWPALGRPLAVASGGQDDGSMVTDLAVLVDAIRDGARRMAFPPPRSPWLDPLPERIQLSELEPYAEAPPDPAEVAPAGFGVTDLPSQQRRALLALDLVRGSHLMLVGGPRSGRSTALRTLAGSLARDNAPGDVHLYAIDCGSNAMLPLVGLPHTGAVVTRDQPERVRRLVDRLRNEITRRQQLLADLGVSSAAEQRASAPAEERLPWMVLLLDAWDGFVSAFEKFNYGQLIESMQQIFREGAAVGLKAVITGDRRGLTGQISSAFPDKLILRLADVTDYTSAGFRPKDIPSEMPSGRALQMSNDGMLESQLALLAADPSGQAQVAALQEIGRRAREVMPAPRPSQAPMRVDALPNRITLSQALALAPDFAPPSPLWVMLGVGGDELQPIGIDLEEFGPGFVIAGPPKSGRSTSLVTAATALLDRGTSLILVTPRRSPLRALAGRAGVAGLLNGESTKNEVEELVKGLSEPYVVVVDDAELVYDTPVDKAITEVMRTGMDGGHAVLAAGTTDSLSSQYRGFVSTARKSRNGLLLMPRNPSEGELFGVRLPANSGGGPVGSGLLITGGALTPIQAASQDD